VTPSGPASDAVPELRIGVADLRRRPGNRRHLRRTVGVGQIAVTTAVVPPPGEAELDVVMESLSDGVTVAGVLRVPWTGECRRCLEPTSGVVEADIAEVFKDRPDEGETHAIGHDAVDLGPVVRDAAVLALPLAPLCRPDCPGPDPEGFPVVTATEGSAAPADPRWAALSELRFDSDPTDSLE
jgi:uncharacterized protein